MRTLRVVSLKIDESLLKALDETARALGVSRSEVIRRALVRYLSESRPSTPKVRVRHVVLT